ncbi:LIM/homeobox protein Awh-like [Hydractinia symbiolongicarpus]|uniref:LIM/homeobox protein Awh-like n=1 Tax=Hydractinia symbiolongicarpus TaxID=13093 RepID=UPI002551B9D4|nr:LIM/homeobox protein Awh-like [Hydractinia symbiolongicarpus]
MHNTDTAPPDTPETHLEIKCCSCHRGIQSSDWVRRAKQNVYHLACFACDVCKRQLSTGEEFALLDNRILCKLHYVEQLELPAVLTEPHPIHRPVSSHAELSPNPSLESENIWMKPNRNKRVRTSFSEEQVQVLQANFEVDANPDSSELERIASDVSLPKRVTQVWFQNSRARQKKQQQQQKMLSP